MNKLLIGAAVGALLLAADVAAQRGGRDPARMLERFDKNKDGKLTEEEVGSERMWNRLVAADKNKDGSITKEELAALGSGQRGRGRRGGGRGRSGEAAWKFLAEKYDKDKDGKLTKTEYDRDEATFKRLDRNQDGVLTAADWQVEQQRGGRRGGGRRGSGRGSSTAPKAGEQAPDFELSYVDDAKKTVKLSSFAGDKPVALIFGSCT